MRLQLTKIIKWEMKYDHNNNSNNNETHYQANALQKCIHEKRI